MIPFDGIVWRIMFAEFGDQPLAPARAPEGRFHHDRQLAIYTSLTAEGAGTAIQRYLLPNDAPRVVVPLKIAATRVLDLRIDPPAEGFVPPTSIVWQDQRAAGLPASTWDISDAARNRGAEAILYPSRSHPNLTHLVVLTPTNPGLLQASGSPIAWP